MATLGGVVNGIRYEYDSVCITCEAGWHGRRDGLAGLGQGDAQSRDQAAEHDLRAGIGEARGDRGPRNTNKPTDQDQPGRLLGSVLCGNHEGDWGGAGAVGRFLSSR